MQKSQLLSILKKLTKKELKAFHQYVKGNYPGKIQQLELLAYLIPFYSDFNNKALDVNTIHQVLYGTKKQGKRIENLRSDLKLLALEFLKWQQLKTNSFEQSFQLIQLLYQRGMNKVADYEYKKLKKQLSQQQVLPLNLHQLLQFNYYQIEVKNNTDSLASDSLKRSYQELNTFYLISTCKVFCELVNRKNIFHENLIEDEGIITQTIQSSLATQPNELLQCYQKALAMNFRKSEEIHYWELKTLYFNNYTNFNSENQHTLLLYLINFCIPKVMQNLSEFEQEAIELHNHGFQTKTIFQNGSLSKTMFLNTVTIGCRLEKWDWVNNIIEENTKYLKDDSPEQTKKIAKAIVTFKQKKYGQTLNLLNQVSFSEDIDNSLRVRGLVALSLFEQKENSTLKDNLINFEKFLIKKPAKLSINVRQRYQRFIKILRLFLKPKLDKALIIAKLTEPGKAIYAKEILLAKINK